MNHLENKVVLITGGCRRIGACTARYLHQHDMRIIIHFNNSAVDAEQIRSELCEIRPDSVRLIQGNLGDIAKVKYLIREAVNALGQLDALVNNASAFFPTPIASSKESQWQTIMDTNLKAPYFLSQAVAPYLKKQNGCIINITDIYAQRPLLDYAIYSASKAGLVSLTKSLANELGPEIRVNAIAPGAILWPENDTDEISHQRMISKTPLKRAGEPEDIAKTIHFLLANSNYITGQVINVDGGRSISP
ncbi:pteridine reductase [Candidatus Spongiihabitans sp.]|uniref:pteridine reductase n=1 Tax=Candidatus Spongiihabitans sp. TaxID=3101308 RepID=UPI003C6FBB74